MNSGHHGWCGALLLLALGAGCAGDAPRAETAYATRASRRTPSHSSGAELDSQDAARCEEGDLSACHAAALDAYNQAPSYETDAAALLYFRRACDGGYAPSCNGLGVLHQQGRGVPLDPVEAARLFRAACLAGASTACQHLAMALRDGRGVEADAEAAARADARHHCAFEASLGRGALDACPPL